LRLGYVFDNGKINKLENGYILAEFDYINPKQGIFKRCYDTGDGYPFTNTGMLASKRTIIPEFKYTLREEMPLGTVLKKYDVNGSLKEEWELIESPINSELYVFKKSE
jgi:hypothetical protein